ncbi:hypothetical protein CYMTET_38952 [Cymbomonas tetramitiformis]|uniref:Protein-serine/threonine kinase n=1 Tax=Cymbomonas tetramitiformis TaxID=36881 RepID=A0AAE0CCR2_9CHLO|nr:hypothetical protein CYMTET_38952 [Cymbomonas tetramitiformis]
MQSLIHTKHPRSAAILAHEELCVRTAQQHRRLSMLPFSTTLLQQMHLETFNLLHENLVSLRRRDPKSFYTGSRQLHGVTAMHGTFEQELMEGVKAFQAQRASDATQVNQQLTDVLSCRIGSLLLMRQAQRLMQAEALSANEGQVPDDRAGPVLKEVSIRSLLEGAAPIAQGICERVHGRAARVLVEGAADTQLLCAPSHLNHVFMELFKNALHATATAHQDAKVPPPDIVARVGVGKNELGIRIIDKGTGMPREHLRPAFEFCYSTSKAPQAYVDGTDAARGGHVSGGRYHVPPPLAGMGLGLPMSRLYTRHFGGDLGLIAVENGGAESTVWLPLMPTILENIPTTVE